MQEFYRHPLGLADKLQSSVIGMTAAGMEQKPPMGAFPVPQWNDARRLAVDVLFLCCLPHTPPRQQLDQCHPPGYKVSAN